MLFVTDGAGFVLGRVQYDTVLYLYKQFACVFEEEPRKMKMPEGRETTFAQWLVCMVVTFESLGLVKCPVQSARL